VREIAVRAESRSATRCRVRGARTAHLQLTVRK
jgi:hypothetical protein